jgi:soluble lytic murein transglycosylase-like protein
MKPLIWRMKFFFMVTKLQPYPSRIRADMERIFETGRWGLLEQALTGCALMAAAPLVHALNALEPTDPALNKCVTAASGYHQVNPNVLKAILIVESNLDIQAMSVNKNGTVDVGIAQINSVHFPELSKFGITPKHLMNACVSTYVAAWHLKKQIASYGNTWYAVGAYHSTNQPHNRRYAQRVFKQLANWGLVPPQKTAKPPAKTQGVG